MISLPVTECDLAEIRAAGANQVNTTHGDSPRGTNPTDELLHGGEGSWRPLPSWARYFLAVGRAAIATPSPGQRLVVAAVVPTREYAAAFVALGAVEQRSRNSDLLGGEAHYSELTSLMVGDKVTVLTAGKKYVASFKGVGPADGPDGILVEFEKDRMTQFLPKDQCHRVAIGALGKARLPKVGTPRDKTIGSWDAAFLESVLGIDNASDYVRRDDFTALIIGQLQALSFELEEEPFVALDARGKSVGGHIEDLIRTKKFADDAEGETFRTEVMSDRARRLDPELAALRPPVVIFDGGRAFEKHKYDWRSASWVIILDRSATTTSEAATVLNQYFVEYRIDDSDPLRAIEPPPGVEVTSFLAKVH